MKKLFHVRYEDGDEEDLYQDEIAPLVVPAVRKSSATASTTFDFPVASASELAQATACVRQIAKNAAEGHCPLTSLSKLYVFFGSEVGLKQRDSVRIFAQRGPHVESADYKVFSKLTGGDAGLDDDNLLLDFMHRVKTPAAAIAPLVDQAVREGLAKSGDKSRLKTVFSSWMAGTSWKKCVLTHSNRPSLASWNGWPWDSFNIMSRGCGLKHAVKWKSIEIQPEWQPPSELVPPDFLPLFQLIWSVEGGVADVEAACAASFTARCEYKQKQKAKKGNGVRKAATKGLGKRAVAKRKNSQAKGKRVKAKGKPRGRKRTTKPPRR